MKKFIIFMFGILFGTTLSTYGQDFCYDYGECPLYGCHCHHDCSYYGCHRVYYGYYGSYVYCMRCDRPEYYRRPMVRPRPVPPPNPKVYGRPEPRKNGGMHNPDVRKSEPRNRGGIGGNKNRRPNGVGNGTGNRQRGGNSAGNRNGQSGQGFGGGHR